MATSELPAHKKRMRPRKSIYLDWLSDLNSNLQILSKSNNTVCIKYVKMADTIF